MGLRLPILVPPLPHMLSSLQVRLPRSKMSLKTSLGAQSASACPFSWICLPFMLSQQLFRRHVLIPLSTLKPERIAVDSQEMCHSHKPAPLRPSLLWHFPFGGEMGEKQRQCGTGNSALVCS